MTNVASLEKENRTFLRTCFHEVVCISKVSVRKKGIALTEEETNVPTEQCPKNVVGVVRVPTQIRVIYFCICLVTFDQALPRQNTILPSVLPIDEIGRHLSSIMDPILFIYFNEKI